MEPQGFLQKVLEIQHGQMKGKRDRVHAVTERTVGLLLVCTGWLMTTDTPPSGYLRWLLIAAIIGIAAISCKLQLNHSKAYLEIADVVRNLSDAFGLFEPGRYIPGRALYPKRWEKFGREHWRKYVLHHWIAIIGMAVVCIFAACSR